MQPGSLAKYTSYTGNAWGHHESLEEKLSGADPWAKNPYGGACVEAGANAPAVFDDAKQKLGDHLAVEFSGSLATRFSREVDRRKIASDCVRSQVAFSISSTVVSIDITM